MTSIYESWSFLWQGVLADLRRLEALDRGLAVFSASTHRYAFHPRASEAELEQLERTLRVPLPEELRYVYSQLGDGGVGPDWGLYRCAALRVHRVPEDAERTLPELLQRELLCVATRYYDWPMLLVCDGPKAGHVVAEWEGIYEHLGSSLAEVYQRWLARELGRFRACQELLAQSDDLEELWRRKDGFLTEALEDPGATGDYCHQGWLLFYLCSLLASPEAKPLPVRTERDLADYLRKSEVKQAFAESLAAWRRYSASAPENPSADLATHRR